jgi:hypothetical protein
MIETSVQRFLAFSTTAFVLVVGCHGKSPPRARWSDWRAEPDSVVWRVASEDATTCRNCIILSELTVMGDSDGGGFLQASQWVTRDSLGRYWIENTGGPKVYGPTGTFIRQVGHSGEGPMEFRGVGPTFTDSAGRVHVFDQRNRRETVIAPDFHLVSERALPWGPIYDAALLPGDDRVVANGVFRDPDHVGFPLHLVEGTQVVTSFGTIERGSLSGGTMHMLRRITVGPDGTIFSTAYFEYSIDVWSQSGQRLLGFKRPRLWKPPPDGQPQPLRSDTDLWGLIQGLHADQSDRLWVIAWVPKEDWRSHTREVGGPGGQTYLQPENGNESLYRTALEIIDLHSGLVLAHQDFDGLIYGFLGGNAVFGVRFAPAGWPRLVVWSVRLGGRVNQTGAE